MNGVGGIQTKANDMWLCSLDLADGPSLFINFNELSENELESNFGLRSGASLNPYMTKIDICESEPSDFLSFGASNFILRRRAFRLNNYDPSDSLQLKLDFDEDLESFLNIGIIKKGFQIDVYFLFLRNTNDVIGSIGNPLKEAQNPPEVAAETLAQKRAPSFVGPISFTNS